MVDDKIYGCYTRAYIKYLNKKFATDFKITSSDYILIDALKYRWQMKILQLFGTPFCSYCGTSMKSEWSLSAQEKSEWVKS